MKRLDSLLQARGRGTEKSVIKEDSCARVNDENRLKVKLKFFMQVISLTFFKRVTGETNTPFLAVEFL